MLSYLEKRGEQKSQILDIYKYMIYIYTNYKRIIFNIYIESALLSNTLSQNRNSWFQFVDDRNTLSQNRNSWFQFVDDRNTLSQNRNSWFQFVDDRNTLSQNRNSWFQFVDD